LTARQRYCAQVIEPALLREGFEAVRRNLLEVTDDVSIVEALGRPVKMTRGSYTNIKVRACETAAVVHKPPPLLLHREVPAREVPNQALCRLPRACR